MKLTFRLLVLLSLSLVARVGLSAASAPVISSVEPPSWWAPHTWNPVRLLLSGQNLRSAQVEAPPGFEISDAHVNPAGSHLMVNLHIPKGARPGEVWLRVVTPGGTTSARFVLLAPLPSRGRFGGFSTDDVIYLVMPDRFNNADPGNDDPIASLGLTDRKKPRHYHGGDIQGVRERLPYLQDLGVTALWLTPWYDNVNHLNNLEKYTADNQRSRAGKPSTDYHGYGAVNFYGVEEHFGDMAQLQRLADDAHAAGMKLIQDQVANHTGPYHPWTTNTPTPTWFNGTVDQHLENAWQTWTIADPDPPQDKLKSTLEGWFINLLPDLNQNDPETSTYLIQNSLWWIGMTGLDAVRQDTLPYVPRSYWSRWTTALKRQYPRITILGEMWDGNPKLVSFFQGGKARFDGVDSGVDTLFDFPLHYALRDIFVKGQPMARLTQTLAADTNYVNPRVLVTFLGLHDTSRFMGEAGATVAGLKLAFTCLATMRGTPMIYYGDEMAMRGGGDPDNRRDFPGGWKEDPKNAFTAVGRTPEQEDVHGHVRRLLELRRSLEPLRRGDLVVLAETPSTLAYARVVRGRVVVVAMNNGLAPATLSIPLEPLGGRSWKTFSDVLGKCGDCPVANGELQVTLPPREAAILVP
jgi:glycosidase